MFDLSLHLLDLAQNSIAAGARRVVLWGRQAPQGRLTVTVEDDGRGMPCAQAARAMDPFYTTRNTRRVGLGLPLFRQAAIRTGGYCAVFSRQGVGFQGWGVFNTRHADMPPLGDLGLTLLTLVRCNPTLDFCLAWETPDSIAALDTLSIRRRLGGTRLDHPMVREWLRGACKERFAGLEGAFFLI